MNNCLECDTGVTTISNGQINEQGGYRGNTKFFDHLAEEERAGYFISIVFCWHMTVSALYLFLVGRSVIWN